MVKQGKRFDAQLKLLTSQFESAVDKKIKAAIEPFQSLHGHIDELENHLNVRLREISVPDLAIFQSALVKAKADIVILQLYQIMISSDPVTEEDEDEAPLIDITRKPINIKKDKD